MTEPERSRMLQDVRAVLVRLAQDGADKGAMPDIDRVLRQILHIIAVAQGRPID